jgi:hypothetical protein
LGARKHFRNVTGNWNDDGSWSTTSGGPADTNAPGPTDTVVFDAGSGTCTLTANTSCGRLLVMGGVLDLIGHDLTVTAPIHAPGGTLRLKGNQTVSSINLGSNSTVEFYDPAVPAAVDELATTYGNFVFGADKTHVFPASTGAASYTITGPGSASSDAAEVQDNTMFDNGPDNLFKRNDDGYRHNEDMYVNRNAAQSIWRYGVVRFDLASIPADAAVTSATLRMYCESGSGSVTVYPVNKPWNYRYVCYNYRDQSAALWWNTPSAPFDPDPGTTDDFDPGASATHAAVAPSRYNDWDVTAVALQWHAGTRGNHGFVLSGDTDGNALTFNTCNHADPARRPQLVVECAQADDIITVKGELRSAGTCLHRPLLRSTSPGTTWKLDLQGASALNSTHQVDVADCDASLGMPVVAYGSAGMAANNTNWVFLTDVIGDLDFDGRVDLDDFALFVTAMSGPGMPTSGCGADLDGDADCDMDDFTLFTAGFTRAP